MQNALHSSLPLLPPVSFIFFLTYLVEHNLGSVFFSEYLAVHAMLYVQSMVPIGFSSNQNFSTSACSVLVFQAHCPENKECTVKNHSSNLI